ncbi:IclR family transcriptional regulator [Niallia endozanthoxylica]|uniref:Glycerol operon regulatory protein n=1 Tax=Niallia endozanthoxylica TaxID=2036016 RepID=A0A5J5I1P4_9BACI|nr:IclR family transcriptional regulator [Niallia endozanthoxylica]KAA9028459.1 IclR family transcriptional regulator [Niallia endozanthoxylica]
MTVELQKEKYSTLQNAIRLLNLFSVDDSELSVTEIANELQIAKSTAHRILISLESEGLIMKNPSSNLYRLGVSFLSLGHAITKNMKLCNHSSNILNFLQQSTGETACLMVLENNYSYVINIKESDYPIRYSAYIGQKAPVFHSSTGLAILAFQPADVITSIIENQLIPAADLQQKIDFIQKNGYYVSMDEFYENVTSIAVPVRNGLGEVIASLAIAGPSERILPRNIPSLAKTIISASEQFTKTLMFS